jgi:hypothetical protein
MVFPSTGSFAGLIMFGLLKAALSNFSRDNQFKDSQKGRPNLNKIRE